MSGEATPGGSTPRGKMAAKNIVVIWPPGNVPQNPEFQLLGLGHTNLTLDPMKDTTYTRRPKHGALSLDTVKSDMEPREIVGGAKDKTPFLTNFRRFKEGSDEMHLPLKEMRTYVERIENELIELSAALRGGLHSVNVQDLKTRFSVIQERVVESKLKLIEYQKQHIDQEKRHVNRCTAKQLEATFLLGQLRLVRLRQNLLREEDMQVLSEHMETTVDEQHCKPEDVGQKSKEKKTTSKLNEPIVEGIAIYDAHKELLEAKRSYGFAYRYQRELVWEKYEEQNRSLLIMNLTCQALVLQAEQSLELCYQNVLRKVLPQSQSPTGHTDRELIDSIRGVIDAQQELLGMEKAVLERKTKFTSEKPALNVQSAGENKRVSDGPDELELVKEETYIINKLHKHDIPASSFYEIMVPDYGSRLRGIDSDFGEEWVYPHLHWLRIFYRLSPAGIHLEPMLRDLFYRTRQVVIEAMDIISKLGLQKRLNPTKQNTKVGDERQPGQTTSQDPTSDTNMETETSNTQQSLWKSDLKSKDTEKAQQPKTGILTSVRMGAFGTVEQASNRIRVELFAYKDTDEAEEEMFKYCQANCLHMFDCSQNAIAIDSEKDLKLSMEIHGNKWTARDSVTPKAISISKLQEEHFVNVQLLLERQIQTEADMSSNEDTLSCKMVIQQDEAPVDSPQIDLSVDYGVSSICSSPLRDDDDDRKNKDIPNDPERPTEPTHLRMILDEYSKLREEFGERYLTENTMQLPFLAIGYFDEEGGRLSLDSHTVQLYIPPGALPPGPPRQVYIYINPNDPAVDVDVKLSPVVQCGPPGLEFMESVVLSLPYKGDASSFAFAQISMESGHTPVWNDFDLGILSTRGRKAVLLIDHFSRFRVVCGSFDYNKKLIQVGATLDCSLPSSTCYNIRFCVWNEVTAESKVSGMNSDTIMFSRLNKPDLSVWIKHVANGWEVRPRTTKVIAWSQVWRLYKNTVTFYMTRKYGATIPCCVVACSQKTQLNRDIRDEPHHTSLMVKPHQYSAISTGARASVPTTYGQNYNRSVPVLNAGKGAFSILPAYHQVHSTKIEHGAPVTSRTCCEEMRSAFAKKVLGNTGGLSPNGFIQVCQLLNAERDGSCYWTQLARKLFKQCGRLIDKAGLKPNPAKKVLEVYFAVHGEEDWVVEQLIDIFRELHFDEEVVQVLQAADVSEVVNQENESKEMNVVPDDDHSLQSNNAMEKFFRELALELGEKWEALATQLGVQAAKLYQIKEDNRGNVGNAIFKMLISWQQTCGTDWDVRVLVEALKQVKRHDLAQKISEATIAGNWPGVCLQPTSGAVASGEVNAPNIDQQDDIVSVPDITDGSTANEGVNNLLDVSAQKENCVPDTSASADSHDLDEENCKVGYVATHHDGNGNHFELSKYRGTPERQLHGTHIGL